ncbi:hypothetical protein [Acidisoma silvae]|uniref:Uncharacterized protein n=1 Tax=Acidisoma silvae TaxID=2802396 RepID=A0A964E1H5_9PROT|nr:hypothetical protein [Acidisoma silvae]MCB8878249.1 hypothetical protein [Acidisoma silvae]
MRATLAAGEPSAACVPPFNLSPSHPVQNRVGCSGEDALRVARGTGVVRITGWQEGGSAATPSYCAFRRASVMRSAFSISAARSARYDSSRPDFRSRVMTARSKSQNVKVGVVGFHAELSRFFHREVSHL